MRFDGHTPRWLAVRALLPFALLAAAFVLVALNVGVEEIWKAFGSVGLPAVALMLGAALFNYLARSLRWYLLYRCVAPQSQGSAAAAMPLQFLVYLGGYAFTLTPGRSGEAVRAWMANRSFGAPAHTGLSLVVADRFYDAVALTLILTATAAMLGSYPVAAGILMAVLSGAVVLLGWLSSATGFWQGAAERVPRLSRLIEGVRSAMIQISAVSRPRRLPLFALVSVTGWSVQALVPAIVLNDMGITLDIADVVFVYAMSTLIGGASFLPGGLGGFEATMIGLLSAMGVPLATALAATFIVRFTTLWFGILIGISTFALWTYISRER